MIRANELLAGLVLPADLYTRQGVKLLRAGLKLNDRLCRTLLATGEREFVLARGVSELAGPALSPVRQSRFGQRAQRSLVTEGGVLAAEAGQVIEEHHADAYALGAYRPGAGDPANNWGPGREAMGRIRTAVTKLADELVASQAAAWAALPADHATKMPPRAGPSAEAAAGPPAGTPVGSDAGWMDDREIAEWREGALRAQRALLARVLAGLPVEAAELHARAAEFVGLARHWPRRYAELALCGLRRSNYLPDQGLTTGLLAAGLALRMGWTESQSAEAAMAGLVADVGMALVPESIRCAPRPLDDAERASMRRHPINGVVMLEAVQGLPEVVRLAVHQHHERCDGSGYPSGERSGALHPVSRLVAVADVYAALTGDRAHRPTPTPFAALDQVQALGSSGPLDRDITRALVSLVGLFPIGSVARLSDGSTARVVGAEPHLPDRPIVVRDGCVIELARLQPWELSVLEVVG